MKLKLQGSTRSRAVTSAPTAVAQVFAKEPLMISKSCRSNANARGTSLAKAAIIAMAVPIALIGSGPASAQPASLSGVVYTADENGGSISSIDLATGKVATQPVPISPHNVQVSADGTRLFAVGAAIEQHDMEREDAQDHGGMAMGEDGLLLVFDAARLAAGPSATIAVGEHPAHVVVDRAGRYAFVTSSEENAVDVVDLERNEVVKTIATGAYPHGLRISPDGATIYVANVEDGSVSILDTAGLAEVARIPVGQAPVQVGFLPDGSRVYLSLRDENAVAVIDTASRQVVGKIAVGRNPIQVYATPDGRFVFVANQGTEADPADTVSVIDVAGNSVAATIRTGAGAHGVTVSDDGKFAFISNIAAATVSVIDVAAMAVIADFNVGEGPNGISYRAGSL